VASPPSLLAAVDAAGRGAFLSDTAPIIYRLERAARPVLVAACDALFDAVEEGLVGCIVSAVSVAELLISPIRSGPRAVAVVDGFLRQPMVGIAEVDADVARGAAELVARQRVARLPDALIISTAIALGLPVVTGDRRLARSRVGNALLVADFAG
jgi:predicted nucleic acid-binding protein